jgi:predicted acetyltransferase
MQRFMIQFGEDKYKEALKRMWKLCFPQDSDLFIDFYFNKVYKNDETLVWVENGQPVAALQMIPYSLKIGTKIFTAGYISGAMTHPDFQKKGYMGRLLNASFEVMKEKGFDYTFLIPQEEWLFGFYGRFGYQRFVSSFKDFKDLKVLKEINSFAEHVQFLATLPNAVLKSEEQFANIVADCLADGGSLIDFKEKRGMIKKINPLVETVTQLYLGRMLD